MIDVAIVITGVLVSTNLYAKTFDNWGNKPVEITELKA